MAVLLILMAPMLFGSLTLDLAVYVDLVPEWYQTEASLYSRAVTFALAGVLFLYFQWENRKCVIQHDLAWRNSRTLLLAGAGYAALFTVTGAPINLREYASATGLNVLYSAGTVFVLVFAAATEKRLRFRDLTVHLLALYLSTSGSKASLLSVLLFHLFMAPRWKALRASTIIVLLVLVASLAFFLPLYLVRYADPGVSLLNFVNICSATDHNTLTYYADVIWRFVTGQGAYNPVITFYEDVGISSGYNVTPTVAGDLACGKPTEIVLLLAAFLLYVHATLRLSARAFGRHGALQKAHIFLLVTILSSTVFDVLKFDVLYWVVALSTVLVGQINQRRKHAAVGLRQIGGEVAD